MILKRFTTALKKQDWPTIIIEISLVIVGVFKRELTLNFGVISWLKPAPTGQCS